jgi:hypothetical protein
MDDHNNQPPTALPPLDEASYSIKHCTRWCSRALGTAQIRNAHADKPRALRTLGPSLGSDAIVLGRLHHQGHSRRWVGDSRIANHQADRQGQGEQGNACTSEICERVMHRIQT